MRIMALATAAALITWAIIIIVHLKFRKAHKNRKENFIYAFALYPYANYFCLCFLALLFCIMFFSGFGKNGLMIQLLDMAGIRVSFLEEYIPVQMPDMSLAVIIIPLWCLFLFLGYKLKR